MLYTSGQEIKPRNNIGDISYSMQNPSMTWANKLIDLSGRALAKRQRPSFFRAASCEARQRERSKIAGCASIPVLPSRNMRQNLSCATVLHRVRTPRASASDTKSVLCGKTP